MEDESKRITRKEFLKIRESYNFAVLSIPLDMRDRYLSLLNDYVAKNGTEGLMKQHLSNVNIAKHYTPWREDKSTLESVASTAKRCAITDAERPRREWKEMIREAEEKINSYVGEERHENDTEEG